MMEQGRRMLWGVGNFSLETASKPATCALRHHDQTEPDLQITSIEKIILPLKNRDELPPILAGLSWLWMHPTLKNQILALLEKKILAGKKRPGALAWACGQSSCWASRA